MSRRRPDLSINQQVWLAFSATALLLALVVIQVLLGLARIRDLRSGQLALLATRGQVMDSLERAVLAQGLAEDFHADTGTPAARDDLEKAVALTHVRLAELQRLPVSDDERTLVAQVLELSQRYHHAGQALAAGIGRHDSAHRELNELIAALRDYSSLLSERIGRSRAAVDSLQTETERTLLALVAAVLVLTSGTAVLTARGVRRPARDLIAATRRLVAGDYGPALALGAVTPASARNELQQLSSSFAQMAVELRQREERLAMGARFAGLCGSHLDPAALCDAALSELVAHVQAELGAIYLVNEELSLLRRQSTYALDGAVETLGLGEGIPGQAARTRATIVVRDVPAESAFAVRLGFDRVSPRALAAVPMVMQERVLGVIVVGCLRDLEAHCVAFLEQAARQLAVSVDNALTHRRVQELAVELQDRNRELQARHEERDEAEQALRESDRRKDEFLALLSHELRNPLTPLRNNLFLLHRAPPGSPQAEQALAVIDRQITHLVFLVDDLLDMARISRGMIRLQCSEVELTPLLRDAAQDAESLFAGRGVRLQLQLPGGTVVVHADPMRLTQVIGDLLHNAGKFTPADGLVTLGLDADVDKRVARIWVRDTGVGIDAATLPRLFEPFAQADPTLARTTGGLGLGLTLVRRLVELHGGTVTGFSEGLGHGSQFTVELPLTEARAPTPAGDEAIRRTPRRVLVIEDNADAAESLRSVLEFMGHEVRLAGDGRTGLQVAREFEPEIVFCDIGLPQMDGYAVARALRAEGKLRDTFLVAMTGYAQPEDQRRAAEAGFHEHVAKPPSIERLEDLLARAALAWSETRPTVPGSDADTWRARRG